MEADTLTAVLIAFLCAAGLAVLYLIVMLAISIVLISAMIHPKGARRTTYEQARAWIAENAKEDMLSWHDQAEKEPFSIMSNGVRIECEHIPPKGGFPEGKPKRCVVRAHGYTQNMMLSVAYARAFHREGYAVVIYDQRAFGRSGGKVCSLGQHERHDLLEIVKWARGRLGEDAIIGLAGESMGAITVLEAAAMDERIAFVVADSAASSALSMIGETDMHRMPRQPTKTYAKFLGKLWGVDLASVDPMSKLDRIKAPVLFIHGEADTTVPARCSREMFAKAGGRPWRLSTYPGARHVWCILVDTERYEREEMEFVREAEKLWLEGMAKR
jgi:dipeptidyl aminopeptidase/acylaminoacyl peptidase